MDIMEDIEKMIPDVFSDMQKTPQNPNFHGEGDVYAHTKMVCNEMKNIPEFYSRSKREQNELFLAALLHDIGKIKTTRLEDGSWISPNHSAVGSLMARKFLWKECGLSGLQERQQIRETICNLIRYHMLPVNMLEQRQPENRLREIASIGELANDFSWKLLCILSEADMRGRIVSDIEESLEKIDLCRIMAEEADCFLEPYHFQDAYTKRAYLSGRNVMPDQSLYDDTWGEVILMSGLPGTGKDTWIQRNLSHLPMVSLDEIRKELKLKPTEPQGAVIQKAQERAKEFLRKKQPFVWNATNITRDTRQKQISLFERYGASVRIVYLETEWNTLLERNGSRADEVPKNAIERMLAKLVLPTPQEAKIVEWYCI